MDVAACGPATALPLRRCATREAQKDILHAGVDQTGLTIKRADSAFGALFYVNYRAE
jgi:hypothetical protein